MMYIFIENEKIFEHLFFLNLSVTRRKNFSRRKNSEGLIVDEKKKMILISAVAIYFVLMLAAGLTYLLMSCIMPAPTEAQTAMPVAAEEKKEAPPKPTEPEQNKKPPKEKEDPAKKAREEAAKEKIRSSNRAVWGSDRTFRELTSGMKETVRGNVTFYTHPYSSKPLSGVYIRPFVIKGHSDAILKNDVYYYSSLEDSELNWVHGDALDINADGQIISWRFDATKRRDHLAKSAENLSENYVETATDATLRDLKTIGNANNVTVTYYKIGGGARTSALSRENIRYIRDMVKLYELFVGDGKNEAQK